MPKAKSNISNVNVSFFTGYTRNYGLLVITDIKIE